MGHRQEAQRRVGRREHGQARFVDIQGNVEAMVGQHGAFGATGGAGSVEQRCQVVAVGFACAALHFGAGFGRCGGSVGQQLVPANGGRIVVGQLNG